MELGSFCNLEDARALNLGGLLENEEDRIVIEFTGDEHQPIIYRVVRETYEVPDEEDPLDLFEKNPANVYILRDLDFTKESVTRFVKILEKYSRSIDGLSNNYLLDLIFISKSQIFTNEIIKMVFNSFKRKGKVIFNRKVSVEVVNELHKLTLRQSIDLNICKKIEQLLFEM